MRTFTDKEVKRLFDNLVKHFEEFKKQARKDAITERKQKYSGEGQDGRHYAYEHIVTFLKTYKDVL